MFDAFEEPDVVSSSTDDVEMPMPLPPLLPPLPPLELPAGAAALADLFDFDMMMPLEEPDVVADAADAAEAYAANAAAEAEAYAADAAAEAEANAADAAAAADGEETVESSDMPDSPEPSASAEPAAGRSRRRRRRLSTRERLLQRIQSNERERQRMQMINGAFDELRKVVPHVETGQRLSKIETLTLARNYLVALTDVIMKLGSAGYPPLDARARNFINLTLRTSVRLSRRR